VIGEGEGRETKMAVKKEEKEGEGREKKLVREWEKKMREKKQ